MAVRRVMAEMYARPRAKSITAEPRPGVPIFPEAALEKHGISRRELEVIRLVCTGKSNREIEGLLYISEKTVKFHLYNAYKKLGIRNRVELVNLMHDLGAEEPTPPA